MSHSLTSSPILRTEDVILVTDRWGNPTYDTDEEPPQLLLDVMWSDNTFVVRRGGRLGILVEVEQYHPDGENDDEVVLQAWGTLDKTVIEPALLRAAVALSEEFPFAEVYVSQGHDVCMGRATIWAFLPEPLCTEERVRQVGEAIFAFHPTFVDIPAP